MSQEPEELLWELYPEIEGNIVTILCDRGKDTFQFSDLKKVIYTLMNRIKLFENFDTNKPVIDALNDILHCVMGQKKISSKLNGSTLIDLYDNCEISDVKEVFLKASEVVGEEVEGTLVDLDHIEEFDPEKIESLIDVLKNQKN